MVCQIYKVKPLPVATGANYPEPDPAEMACEVTTCKQEIDRLTAELGEAQKQVAQAWRTYNAMDQCLRALEVANERLTAELAKHGGLLGCLKTSPSRSVA